MSDTISADVAIVGSGVSGALIAAKLAAAGVSVVILEAGARVDREDAVEKFFNAAVKVPECPYPPVPQAMHPTTDRLNGWYRQEGPDEFGSTYIKVVGGTTWHWLGTCLRLVPNDFKLNSLYGRGVDWPISYADLEPMYGEAEKEIGVSGDPAADVGAPRTTGYPMPEIPQTYLDKMFVRALQNTKYQVRATPQGWNSDTRDDRPPCCGNASCIPICPIKAKYDATVHVDRAIASGARLLEKTNAVFVEVNPDRTVGAIRFKRWDGSEGRAVAKVFVIAAHAIETPRLLLHSKSELTPNGVANSSDQVGRNLMDHPTQLSWALARDAVYPYRGPQSTSGIENLNDGSFRKERAAFRIEIGNDGWSWPIGAPISTAQELAMQGLRGDALDDALEYQCARHIRLASLVEQLPSPENRVRLDDEMFDAYGVGLPRISYRLDDYTKAGFAAAKKAHDEIFEAVGTSRVEHDGKAQGAGHIIGTTRMGENPATSVVDKDLRAHDYPNLFIVGSSVFPTSGVNNPTLTIAALALRAAKTVQSAISERAWGGIDQTAS